MFGEKVSLAAEAELVLRCREVGAPGAARLHHDGFTDLAPPQELDRLHGIRTEVGRFTERDGKRRQLTELRVVPRSDRGRRDRKGAAEAPRDRRQLRGV